MFLSTTTGLDTDARTITTHTSSPFFSVEIAHYGATLLSFHTGSELGDMEVLGGYNSLEDLQRGYASRNWIMAPFANRIPDGRYSWQGVDYILPEGSRMHGLVANKVWTLLDSSPTDDAIELTFTLDTLADGQEGYPFELLYTLTYIITLHGIKIELTATNIGEQDAPYFVGWHTYFTLGESSPDFLSLQIPSLVGVAMDELLVPLDGDDAFVRRETGSQLDFREVSPIATRCIDDYFIMNGGTPQARLVHSSKNLSLEVAGERGCMIAFTSDSLEDAPRSAIALEPMECIANSFNRADMQDQILLKAGTSRSYSASFSLSRIELSQDK